MCAFVAHAKPNIIFIMVDDLGKDWISCYGADNIQTPHIDALAKGGMKFHNAWSMPQCTPTRATLLTGQYPAFHGAVDVTDTLDPARSPLLADLLVGSFVVENLFQIPGIGVFLVNSSINRDYTMVVGLVILYSVMLLTLNLAVDVVYGLLDKRVKYG